jgi:F0F1-type ATP synthase assembly protein I
MKNQNQLSSKNRKPSPNNNRDLIRYASLGTQLLVSIGLAVFIGLKADKWLHTTALFATVLPLLTLFAIFFKLYRDTNRPKKNE